MAAPLAHFDAEWPALAEVSVVPEQKGRVAAAAAAGEAAPRLLPDDGDDDPPELHDSSFSPGGSGAFRSIEDLVNDFDDKLTACFRNFDAVTDTIAPVNVITEETLLEQDEWVFVCCLSTLLLLSLFKAT